MAAEFLSTPPPRVATVFLWVAGSSTLMFLSTPPSRVATVRSWRSCSHSCVSIHATLAGGDQASTVSEGQSKTFLSTPPSRVATLQIAADAAELSQFLSTPPPRVATISMFCASLLMYNFYPRHPRGWRRRRYSARVMVTVISIHATPAGGDCERLP